MRKQTKARIATSVLGLLATASKNDKDILQPYNFRASSLLFSSPRRDSFSIAEKKVDRLDDQKTLSVIHLTLMHGAACPLEQKKKEP